MKLPDGIWKSRTILMRLHQEALFDAPEKGHYWVVVPLESGGEAEMKNFEEAPMHILPHEIQQSMAHDLRKFLQEEISHDGVWIVGWTNPPSTYEAITETANAWGRLMMIWLDEDGDPQFTAESDLPLVQMIGSGPLYYVEMAEKAYQQWNSEYGKKALKADFGVTEDQQTKETLSTM